MEGKICLTNLEQSISEWRQQMLAAGVKSPVPLDELESHLRDEIEHQTTRGLSEAEAFQSAVKHIGQAHAIKTEFKKVKGTVSVREWTITQILSLGFATLFPLFVASQLALRNGAFAEMASGQLMFCWAAMATMFVLPWTGRLGYRFFPIIRSKRTRDIITGLGSALLMLWLIAVFRFILPEKTDIGGILVTVLWGFAPWGAVLGLILGLEAAARKRPIA